jgi:hypothetical protein
MPMVTFCFVMLSVVMPSVVAPPYHIRDQAHWVGFESYSTLTMTIMVIVLYINHVNALSLLYQHIQNLRKVFQANIFAETSTTVSVPSHKFLNGQLALTTLGDWIKLAMIMFELNCLTWPRQVCKTYLWHYATDSFNYKLFQWK